MEKRSKPFVPDLIGASLPHGFVHGSINLRLRPCAFAGCRKTFKPRRLGQLYCSTPCKKKHHNLKMCRGAQIYDAAMKWRRGRKIGSLAALSRLVDDFIDDDRRMKDD